MNDLTQPLDIFQQLAIVIPPLATPREKIDLLVKHLSSFPQVELPVNHHFAPGIYMRELPVPADLIIVGKVHKFKHFKMLLKGDVTFVTEGGTFRAQAPFIMNGEVGECIAFYAHTDMSLMTVHALDRDMNSEKELEDYFTCENYEKFEQYEQILLLKGEAA